MWLICAVPPASCFGIVAGSGRNRNARNTVPAHAAGTTSAVVTSTPTARSAARIRDANPRVASVGHPPSVDALARSLASTGLPHPVLVDVAREAIAAGDPDGAATRAAAAARRLLTPVVNATGVLLHTNLGRSPLGVSIGASYGNL